MSVEGLEPSQFGAPASPSGRQFTIGLGEQAAVITEVGATLRSYTTGGVDLIDGFDETVRAHDGRGQVLAPWPNRLAQGRYEFGGREVQAALSEPSRGDAIHGLVRWLPWRSTRTTADEVNLACTIHPQPGYEWSLSLEVSYRLAGDGLQVSAQAVNLGSEAAPFGIGFHPYLTLGLSVDNLELEIPARAPSDYLTPKVCGDSVVDADFTDLRRDADGRAVARVRDPDSGRCLELWVDTAFSHLMVYTADQVSDPARRRRAVAIEPMTSPLMRSDQELT